ncbi:hypothetical protein [Xenorhabdus hominickii]|uniref:Uncharacterized protein n=1 Tax=Xenorhabdus hominickii TaxID=351679 RepID=A0A2G0Q254_XENHO|nr:hypothetical protein [Xenorhabdus hominickii]AOM40201.1 hypothetical protein A9255_06175 [Xenorhabdus hominickii]PHM53298.1 hypothetical protein Xhom_04193 [Xenorhabdus hominickii]
MAIIFHKDNDWFQTPNVEQQHRLMASKNRQFCFVDEHRLSRKISRCYPRGRAYSKLERLEYKASKRDYSTEKLRAFV